MTPQGLEEEFASANSRSEFASGYLRYLSSLLDALDADVFERIIDALQTAASGGTRIYIIGNGGSASIATHFANDLSIGAKSGGVVRYKAQSLAANLAIVTALANDEGYENVFVSQMEGVVQAGDVVIALSVSGNSENVVSAVAYARSRGAVTIGCTGFDGGSLRAAVDISLHIPTRAGEYGPVEDIFLIVNHLVGAYLKLESRVASAERAKT